MLLFFWLNDVKLAIERVTMRVSEGGHNIPVEVIERRYWKGIKNLVRVFVILCDYWMVIDNSDRVHLVIAEGVGSEKLTINDMAKWATIKIAYNERS